MLHQKEILRGLKVLPNLLLLSTRASELEHCEIRCETRELE
jgi:hypothetical protein